MRNTLYALALTSGLALFSCTSGGEKSNASNGSDCTYTLNYNEASMSWTGFKTNKKTPVNGTFTQFGIEEGGKGKSAGEALIDSKFTIGTSSVSSGDAARDANLKNYFFGLMENPTAIEGYVQSIEGGGNAGVAQVYISMNGVGAQQTMDYAVNEGVLEISGTMELAQWEAIAAVESLNKQCYDLHKGEDGGSKLWQMVDIMVKVPFTTSNCPE